MDHMNYLGAITDIRISKGVYATIGYEIKEIEYVIEEIDSTIIELKTIWLNVQNSNVASDAEKKEAYNNYINALDVALNEQEGDYAL